MGVEVSVASKACASMTSRIRPCSPPGKCLRCSGEPAGAGGAEYRPVTPGQVGGHPPGSLPLRMVSAGKAAPAQGRVTGRDQVWKSVSTQFQPDAAGLLPAAACHSRPGQGRPVRSHARAAGPVCSPSPWVQTDTLTSLFRQSRPRGAQGHSEPGRIHLPVFQPDRLGVGWGWGGADEETQCSLREGAREPGLPIPATGHGPRATDGPLATIQEATLCWVKYGG